MMQTKFKRVNWLTILIAFNFGFLILNGVVAWKIFAHEPPRQTLLDTFLNRQSEPQSIDYKDFISIMLTGLSAMITVLGIGLATIAIWGYARLSEDAKEAAADKAMSVAQDVATAVATRTVEAAISKHQTTEESQRLFEALSRGNGNGDQDN
ncbi:hypothetical protein [Methylobacterium goesingense]|uniref:Uncharacterized protein n=1 Tax=Methylobacterium goesingense TaxID=243690 RepID=A0ABV2L9P7_9HYPH|nr:hypothetical protein [Methylobacterium goesingense]